MTRVRSRVLAPAGGPQPGVYVSAVLLDEPSEIRQPHPEAISGPDGWWELDLVPNTQLSPGSFYRIREYLVGDRARAAVVPDPPAGGTAVLLGDIEIDPTTPPPDPEPEPGTSLWLYRAELGVPDGVAQLGPDRLVRPEQLPTAADRLAYLHTQDLPSTVWIVDHGLPFEPAAVDVVDHIGSRHYPHITHPDPLTVRLDFGADTRGTARLS